MCLAVALKRFRSWFVDCRQLTAALRKNGRSKCGVSGQPRRGAGAPIASRAYGGLRRRVFGQGQVQPLGILVAAAIVSLPQLGLTFVGEAGNALPGTVETPSTESSSGLAVRDGRLYANDRQEKQHGNSGLTGNEGDASSRSAHKRCPILTNRRTGHPLTTNLLSTLKLLLFFCRSASESKS